MASNDFFQTVTDFKRQIIEVKYDFFVHKAAISFFIGDLLVSNPEIPDQFFC